MLKEIYAKDYKCCVCGKQAEVFLPCIDPDIKEHPYCKNCQKESEIGLLIKLGELEKNVHS